MAYQIIDNNLYKAFVSGPIFGVSTSPKVKNFSLNISVAGALAAKVI
jgi:hypothetical protein